MRNGTLFLILSIAGFLLLCIFPKIACGQEMLTPEKRDIKQDVVVQGNIKMVGGMHVRDNAKTYRVVTDKCFDGVKTYAKIADEKTVETEYSIKKLSETITKKLEPAEGVIKK